MTLDDLEESLAEILPAGFQIETNRHGEIIIYTGLVQDDDGDLIDMEDSHEEDYEFSGEFEPLEDEDQEDE